MENKFEVKDVVKVTADTIVGLHKYNPYGWIGVVTKIDVGTDTNGDPELDYTVDFADKGMFCFFAEDLELATTDEIKSAFVNLVALW